MAQFSDLPPEIHLKIIKKCGLWHTVTALYNVSTQFRSLIVDNKAALFGKAVLRPELECLWAGHDHGPHHPRPCHCEECIQRANLLQGNDADYSDLEVFPRYRNFFNSSCICSNCTYKQVLEPTDLRQIIQTGLVFSDVTTLISLGYKTEMECPLITEILTSAPNCTELWLGQRHYPEHSLKIGTFMNRQFGHHYDLADCHIEMAPQPPEGAPASKAVIGK